MKTEQWALLVSFLALVAAIWLPIWQARVSSSQVRAARCSLLLQTVLTAKSTTFVALHELLHLLRTHGNQMKQLQRETLQAMVPRMREHHDGFEQLHDAWADFSDNASLQDIEAALASASVAASDAADTSQLIENERRSYEVI